MASIQSSNATHNFTQRVRINQKDDLFKITLVEESQGRSVYNIDYDFNAILDNANIRNALDIVEVKLVFEAYQTGQLFRRVLDEHRSADILAVESASSRVNPDFKIKVISLSENDKGKILASTSNFKVKSNRDGDSSGGTNVGIFKPNPVADLNGRIWFVEWLDDDLDIQICEGYWSKFKDKEVFSAHVFPEIVRNIATGLLFRFDSASTIDKDSMAGKWVMFVEQRLGIPLRQTDEPDPYTLTPEGRLDYVEDIVVAFTSKKWRNDKTLLEELIK